jgi:hypothetical protein
MQQIYRANLISQDVDGAAYASSTTATSLLHAAAKYRFKGNELLNRPGARLLVRAHGRVSTLVTAPGTLTFEFRLGPTSNIAVASSGAIALNIVAKVNVPWILEWELTLRAVGASTAANFMHQGKWISEANVGAPVPGTGGATVAMMPNATPAVGTGFDSTVENIADLFATWSVNSASNSIQVHGYELISEN